MQVYNFNAGPAALPKPVMLKAQEEFVNYHGTGIGIIEESHRAKPFDEIIQAAEANVRKILGVPENYAVLFLQGGASLQFAMAPMNLMVPGKKVGVADTGVWAHKALKEIKIQKGDVDLVYDGSANGYTATQIKGNPLRSQLLSGSFLFVLFFLFPAFLAKIFPPFGKGRFLLGAAQTAGISIQSNATDVGD